MHIHKNILNYFFPTVNFFNALFIWNITCIVYFYYLFLISVFYGIIIFLSIFIILKSLILNHKMTFMFLKKSTLFILSHQRVSLLFSLPFSLAFSFVYVYELPPPLHRSLPPSEWVAVRLCFRPSRPAVISGHWLNLMATTPASSTDRRPLRRLHSTSDIPYLVEARRSFNLRTGRSTCPPCALIRLICTPDVAASALG